MLSMAHRGASAYAPENTLAAMDLAIKQGCDALELDVHLSKDGHLIVCHDNTVDRTTNGIGKICDLTLEQIKKLDAGSWFSDEFIGEKVPTLEEVFNFIPSNMLLDIEIKKHSTDNDNTLGQKIVDILVKHKRIEHSIVSSFNHPTLLYIKTLNSEVKIGALMEADIIEPTNYFKMNDLDIYSYHPFWTYVSEDIIRKFHDEGIRVFSWTVNDVKTAKELKCMGIDGIITNFPDILTKKDRYIERTNKSTF